MSSPNDTTATTHCALTWLLSLPGLWFKKIISDLLVRKKRGTPATSTPLPQELCLFSTVCDVVFLSSSALIFHAGLRVPSKIFYTPHDMDIVGSLPPAHSQVIISPHFGSDGHLAIQSPVTGFSHRAPDTSLSHLPA